MLRCLTTVTRQVVHELAVVARISPSTASVHLAKAWLNRIWCGRCRHRKAPLSARR
jgi:hypothetical protein